MRSLKWDRWKAGIIIAGILSFLFLFLGIPLSTVSAQGSRGTAATPTPATIQTTPTEDATVIALNKEKIESDIRKNLSDIFWAWTAMGTIIVGLVGIIFSAFQFLRNRRDAQDKDRKAQAEERFLSAVMGLGDEKEGAKIGAAILLRTFLRPGYEQFYNQTFDLAVANLRPTRTSNSLVDPGTPLPLTTLRQALVAVFKEAFPLASQLSTRVQKSQKREETLDATDINLDNAYLRKVDLNHVWMPKASLQKADLSEVNLNYANLEYANIRGAKLFRANLTLASLNHADLSDADLFWSNLTDAGLTDANLTGTDLRRVNFAKANLPGANLTRANLIEANLEDARSLKGTNLHKVTGLSKEQLAACKAKGAIIDEATIASASQPTTSLPAQSDNTQTPSAPPAQVNTPPPSVDGSSGTSFQPSTES